MSLGKNLGKFRQWTSERMGGAEKTDTSDDFKLLELETDQRRESWKSKRKPTADDKGKSMPIEALGACMVNQAYLLGEEMPYGKALLKAGQAHERIAVLQGDFVNKARAGYYANLDRSLTDMKDYNNLRKKLENRRLDLDAKLSKLQKAKKEKPELEEEMRAAQVKYDDTLSDVRARMVIIAEAEEYHVRDLTLFVEAELAHYQKAVEILTPVVASLKEICAAPKPKKYLTTALGNGSASVGRSLTYSESRRRLDYESEGSPLSTTASYDDLEIHPSVPKQQTGTSRVTERQAAPPPIPRRTPKKQVRCLYDFETGEEDELTMVAGEIITVTKEIDEGWWVGEIGSGSNKRSGMFPVNYTEPLKESSSRTSGENQPSILGGGGGLFNDPEELSDANLASRPSFRRTNTANSSASSTHTLSRPASGTAHTNGATYRESAPARPTGPKPGMVSSSTKQPATARASYLGPGEAALGAGETCTGSSAKSCRECGCNDFSANVFKRGSCNNCFHAH
ncbi:hypothetical protein L0F63_007232 [Massospora cicadina]|nr:hypothetical protein L0F63_007232 [Massospora cicadina]